MQTTITAETVRVTHRLPNTRATSASTCSATLTGQPASRRIGPFVRAISALTVSILFGIEGQRPSEQELAREAAIQDFAIAMAYLQKSALVARNEVNEAVGAGMMGAWAVGRDAIGQTGLESDEGE